MQVRFVIISAVTVTTVDYNIDSMFFTGTADVLIKIDKRIDTL